MAQLNICPWLADGYLLNLCGGIPRAHLQPLFEYRKGFTFFRVIDAGLETIKKTKGSLRLIFLVFILIKLNIKSCTLNAPTMRDAWPHTHTRLCQQSKQNLSVWHEHMTELTSAALKRRCCVTERSQSLWGITSSFLIRFSPYLSCYRNTSQGINIHSHTVRTQTEPNYWHTCHGFLISESTDGQWYCGLVLQGDCFYFPKLNEGGGGCVPNHILQFVYLNAVHLLCGPVISTWVALS